MLMISDADCVIWPGRFLSAGVSPLVLPLSRIPQYRYKLSRAGLNSARSLFEPTLGETSLGNISLARMIMELVNMEMESTSKEDRTLGLEHILELEDEGVLVAGTI